MVETPIIGPEVIVIGVIGFLIFIVFMFVRLVNNASGAERKEESDERKLARLEREEEKNLGLEMRGDMGEQQFEQSEFRYERQIMQNLFQIQRGIASTIPYSRTSPYAARRYASAVSPYITNVIRMLNALKTMEQREEKGSQQEKKTVQKTEKIVKQEEAVTHDLENAEKKEEKIDFSNFFNQMGGR